MASTPVCQLPDPEFAVFGIPAFDEIPAPPAWAELAVLDAFSLRLRRLHTIATLTASHNGHITFPHLSDLGCLVQAETGSLLVLLARLSQLHDERRQGQAVSPREDA